MDKKYAGIGSRETPPPVLKKMTVIASYLYQQGYILRSGGAKGADTAFEKGASSTIYTEIYLPWKEFNNHQSELFVVNEKALALAEKYHPAWASLSRNGKYLIARNGYQVLGKNLNDPVDFIVCWTPGGKLVGGTAQALRIARDYKIPVFNLAKKQDVDHINECILTQQTFA